MIYTKDNIIGLEFQTWGKGTIHKIEKIVKSGNYLITWNNKRSSTEYNLNIILEYLNNGKTWIPINQPQNLIYEIY